jgi:hypothetical protein
VRLEELILDMGGPRQRMKSVNYVLVCDHFGMGAKG